MRSKTSKSGQIPQFLWKAASDYFESELSALAQTFAREVRPGDRVLLHGPMGAGKSTFARHLLHALGVQQTSEGSPTFALAHEYRGALCPILHMDFYRIKNESELEAAGLVQPFWDPSRIILVEWISLLPSFEASVLQTGRNWVIRIEFKEDEEHSIHPDQSTKRRIQIDKIHRDLTV